MSFQQIIDRWPSRSAIRGAAIINEDGFLVHAALAEGLDHEAVAALGVTLLRHARQFGGAAGGGVLGAVVIELENGPAILLSLDIRHTLVVLAVPNRDLGQLLWELRSARVSLAGVI